MAGINAPDPRTIESWEQAFQKHSIPEVRVIEQKARGNIRENQERLRTLVGTSYRDLLGTARTIVGTNEQIQEVESLLANIGRKSDSRLVDKIASNYETLHASYHADKNSKFALASHLSVLQQALSAVARLLRSQGSSLLAGKLWILARLCHQVLSSKPNAPPVVHSFGKRLDALRERLRRHIDRELVSTTKQVPECAQCLATLSIVTSSTPTDVLRYFQRLRLATLRSPSSDQKAQIKANILRRLRLFLGTLRGSRSLFPDALSAVLKVLGSKPLLEDELLLCTEELNLDVHRQWLTDDIKNFRPWTRHDELTKSKAQSMLKSWAEDGLVAMVQGIQSDLDLETDIKTILDIRKEVLQEWLSSRHARSAGISSTEVLNKLRAFFLERIESLIHSAFASLKNGVCQSVENVLDRWNESLATSDHQYTTIWDSTLISTEYGSGAGAFKEAVVNGFTGRDEHIRTVVASYAHSLGKIDIIKSEIQDMKNEHWDDADDFDEDYDEIDEDEIEPASVIQVLSKSDPEKLRSTVDDAAARCITEMETALTSVLTSSQSNMNCATASSRGIFVLRVIRELRKRIAQLSSRSTPSPNLLICQNVVDQIHSNLAKVIVEQIEPDLTASLKGYVQSTMVIKSIWDGHDPPLPVNPAPATFRYLRALSKKMENLGPDIWSPPAVRRSKQLLSVFAREAIKKTVEELEDARDARHSSPKEKSAEEQKAAQFEDTGDAASTNGASDAKAESETDVEQETKGGPEKEEQADRETSSSKQRMLESTTEDQAEVKVDEEVARASPDQTVDKLIQLTFDALYLAHLLGSNQRGAEWREIVSKLRQKTELSEAAMTRLQKSAADYWRRTYLLFGLLCAPGTF